MIEIPAIIRRKLLLCGVWIGAALVTGGLLWFFTQTYRTRLLIETVNKTLAANGGMTIEAQPGFSGGSASVMGGLWFSVNNSSGQAFVFTMLQNGIAAACVALTDSNGKVETIIPLSGNAQQFIEKLPLPVFRFYADRIERDARNRNFYRETRQ